MVRSYKTQEKAEGSLQRDLEKKKDYFSDECMRLGDNRTESTLLRRGMEKREK